MKKEGNPGLTERVAAIILGFVQIFPSKGLIQDQGPPFPAEQPLEKTTYDN